MRAAAVEACEARVGSMEVGSVVATCGEAGRAMRMVVGEVAMAVAAMAVVVTETAAAAMVVAAEMVAVAQMVVSVTVVGTVQEVMATVVAVEAYMALVGCREVGAVMATHVEEGWAVLMVVEVAMVVSAMVEAMVREALAMAAVVEADVARVHGSEVGLVMAKHVKMVVVVRALEATGRAVGAEGWMVQVHVEEGWAMRMVVEETVQEA